MPCKSPKAESSNKKNPPDTKVLTTPDTAQKHPANNSVQGDRATSVQNGKKIFALIIGIDDYGHDGHNLKGAKADADKFEKFVRDKLNAPPNTNIFNLRDKHATRSAIINGFRSLENNKAIVRNDATTIIYYAGHGAVADKPKDWVDWPAPENKLEMLCPADMSFPDSSVSTGSSSKVDGIPDRTINRLLLDFSVAKGDNIILILDCCHSAGLNRSFDPAVRQRQILSSIPIEISLDCDSAIYSRQEISASGEAITKSGFSGSLWYSHVLLAACSRREFALEEYQEGVFTRALLNVLNNNDLKKLTYRSLILKQTPHWDGRHVVRRIFSSPEEAADRSRVVCDCLVPDGPGHNRLRLMSGSLHGTTKGSTFEIYKTDLACDLELLATASVDEVGDAFVSYLTIFPPNEHIFARDGKYHFWYARLTKSNIAFTVYCKDREFLARIKTDACATETCAIELLVTVDSASTPDEANLLLEVKEGSVSFERYGGERKNLGVVKDFPWSIHPTRGVGVDDIAIIRQIINHYAHFTYHLTRKSIERITKFISIEMRSGCSTSSDVIFESKMSHASEAVEPVQVTVDMTLDEKKRTSYGFEVRNVWKETRGLYIYLLYFDASTLQIDVFYSPQMGMGSNGAVDSRLGKTSPLVLGLGGNLNDMQPVTFELPQDQNVDVCFFQFIVATEPVDVKSIWLEALYSKNLINLHRLRNGLR
ncbi:caspase domain-containing protein [Armillaria luteobubalina]|uniref:Caspase domain-containing protein n=1 Tax=Armillaria luteobubalina TaxID=153913 RepID=A0AA39QBK4_9AGAR|nr:caspase domain-containing protein [Armillaria luteobubalina]